MSFEIDLETQLEILSLFDSLNRERQEIDSIRRRNTPSNISLTRKEVARNFTLKSDLKKSNAFVKKIKSLNPEGIAQCVRDAESLNLTLFLSEIVSAILATSFKATDVSNVVKLCVLLHQRYEEFTEPFVSGLKTALLSNLSNDSTENDGDAGKRKRIQIKFAVELYQIGIMVDEEFYCQLLRSLVGKQKGSAPSKQSMDLQGLGTFVKYASEVLIGYIPRKLIDMAAKAEKSEKDIPTKQLSSPQTSSEMKAEIQEIYQQLASDLVTAHREFRKKESKYEKDKVIHGSVTEQKQVEFDNSKRLFDKLLSIVNTLSECTGLSVPILQYEKEEEESGKGLTVWEIANNSVAQVDEYNAHNSFYGDAETRSFYEDLPDLLALVPLTILGLTPEQAQAIRDSWATSNDSDKQDTVEGGNESKSEKIESNSSNNNNAIGEDENNENDDNDLNQDEPLKIEVDPAEDAVDESKKTKLHALLTERILDCVNKQKTDEFCVSYCYLNTKNAKKKLIEALIRLPRVRSELASSYSRIIASLARLYPDIVQPILDALRKEFYGMLKAKNQLYIDNKIKNIRYQGELVKFRIAPPIVAFKMFKALLSDFSLHNVELLAVLLETCGRFLYLLPYTSERMNEILETMLRLRRAKNLDLRQQTLLESAYFAVKPPEKVASKKKTLTTVQKYIHYLIQERLESSQVSVETIIKSIRRLPWQDKDEKVEFHIIKAVMKVSRTKYVSIPNIADCLSGLAKYFPNLLIQVVDRVLEEVQRGLDSPYKREPQRMLGVVKLLGELYNFTAVSSNIIFDLLYHIINYGHRVPSTTPGVTLILSHLPHSSNLFTNNSIEIAKFDPRIPSEVDSPTDLFRAQLVCEILNTCGMYYVRGQTKEKLSRFLVFFQRYLLTKQFIPLHIEFCILDTFDSLEELARAAMMDMHRKSYITKAPKGRGKVTAPPLEFKGLIFPRFENMESVQEAVELLENSLNLLEEEAASEREARKMMEKLRIAEEDEEFEKAFKNIMQESVSSAPTAKSVDITKMAIPAVLPKPKNSFPLYRGSGEDDDGMDDDGDNKPKGLAFKLLSRDSKGRVETRQLIVSEENQMAIRLMKAEEAQRIAKQQLKERVLHLESLTAENEVDGLDPSTNQQYFGQRDTYTAPPPPAISANTMNQNPRVFNRNNNQNNGIQVNTNIYRNRGGRRGDDMRKPADSLNLDEFLAESSAAEMRKLTSNRRG
eukprot:gene9687-13040_t